jgi:hypothetical protein
VLGIERGHLRPKGEADQCAAQAAQHVQQVGAARGVSSPNGAGDDADPRCDDRGEPEIGLPDEARECPAVDCGRSAEKPVHEERCEHVAGEPSEDDDARGRNGECREADERETEQRRHPRPVGDDAARQQEPDPASATAFGLAASSESRIEPARFAAVTPPATAVAPQIQAASATARRASTPAT